MNRSQLAVAQAYGFLIQELPGLYQVPKAIYYNKKGEAMKLPADPYSMKHYLAKGYRLEAPKSNEEKFTCDVCGKEFSTKIALTGHRRSHK